MSSNDAQLCEIFTSIQGEGVYLGEKQVFIRFSGCNLSCDYCDSIGALSFSPEYKVEQTPGKQDFKNFKNPVPVAELLVHISAVLKPTYYVHSISLTGGEPLLQVNFSKNLLPELKKNNIKVYLETNGTLPQNLEEIIDFIDIVAMDIKLPSACNGSDYFKEHKLFLEIAYTKEVFVKVPVVPTTTIKEIDTAAKLVAEIDDSIPLVIQPVTPNKIIKHMTHFQNLLAWQTISRKSLKNVRIIPQIHKFLGIL